MRYIFVFLALFFCACGYVPTSKMANNIFHDDVYLEVEIADKDPKNSIFVVDAIRDIIINKFGKNLVQKNEAKDFIYVKMGNLDFQPIIYDENGYVVGYRAKLFLEIKLVLQNGLQEFITTSGDYDFDILPNSIISDNARYEAIRAASDEAFDEFVSVIAIKGQRHAKDK
ncbi:putative lipooligosaccharide transport system, OM component (LptE family) [Campylobacter avium LMG 24591]|uniref:Putative lipooligosaccharide transport system, OM component (LptE family) n=1 Tax=Campylobacter avium LMG 24591 TaxID=522484 RepID=A0A222MX32_9BACT|nr:LPS assembly lipoprotein LptE [Campylobacter avium]ASQ30445.1 putative lipooligosaccharide transport system, OM component (LptE family) [Campylobacter avium LMG 24591]OYD79542.1 putative lipooligosaccharide transport system, OM component (LptE family) [Campylobacter avium]